MVITKIRVSTLNASNSKGESSQLAKDILLNPKEQYTPKSIIEETILYIEPADEKWMTDPWEIKRWYLTTQQFPPHFDQYRYVYEQILTETGSAEMKLTLHDPSKTASPIQYSKITIQNIMPITTWGIHPHTTRQLDIRNRKTWCSYWDYIDAFTNAFYYQNPINNHSWFIRISPDVFKNYLPNWFLVWWDKFGLQFEILPVSVREAYNDWHIAYSHLPGNKNISISISLTHFTIRFGIPMEMGFSM